MKPKFFERIKLAYKVATGSAIEKTGKRYYNGAATNRLTSDWGTTVTSADAELRNDLGALRSRWRQLERDNDYAARYLSLIENNVIGSEGIDLYMHILDPNGSLDTQACGIIEDAWAKWGKRANCTTSGLYSFDDVSRLALRSAARDGSILIQKIIGAEAGNSFGFALKPMEADHLDRFYSGYAPNGNEVRLGVEYDKDTVGQKRKPVAYWITPRHPGDFIGYSGNYTRRRIPADEIIHIFRPTRFEQSEGVPWGSSAMSSLNMLGSYQEAALVASRAGACQSGFFENENGEEFKGDWVDADGNQLRQMEPGVIEDLPMGKKFVANNPNYPHIGFGEFVKSVLRGAASGLSVSYNTLANDLEGVNYSSIRAGLLDERDTYRQMQRWFIDAFCEQIFQAWLPLAFLSKEIPLPFTKIDKFNAPTWKARTWAWVDPMKDQEANLLAINNLLDSPQHILASQGRSPEKVLDEIEEWQRMVKERNLKLPDPNPNKPSPVEPDGDDNSFPPKKT